jgi:tetratricopeptide (TPR) repeat protein
MTSLARFTIAGALLAASAPAARAQTPPNNKTEAEAAFADGQREYANKQYKDAAGKFRYAYSEDPDPIYLFNAAQAYRLAGDCASALEEYRTFYNLVKDKQVSGLEKVQQYIDEESKCARDAVQPPVAQPPPVVQQPPAVGPQGPPPPPEYHASHTPEIALFVGGAVLLGLGALGTVKERDDHSDAIKFEQTTSCTGVSTAACNSLLDKKFNNDGKSWSNLAVGSYIVGGAAVIAGAVLLYMHRNDQSGERMISAVPMRDGGEVVATWRF